MNLCYQLKFQLINKNHYQLDWQAISHEYTKTIWMEFFFRILSRTLSRLWKLILWARMKSRTVLMIVQKMTFLPLEKRFKPFSTKYTKKIQTQLHTLGDKNHLNLEKTRFSWLLTHWNLIETPWRKMIPLIRSTILCYLNLELPPQKLIMSKFLCLLSF